MAVQNVVRSAEAVAASSPLDVASPSLGRLCLEVAECRVPAELELE